MIGAGRLQCHTSVAEIGCLPNRKTSAPCWWPTRSLGHCHPMESSIRRAEESNYQRHCETTPSDFLRGSQEQQKMEKKIASQWITTYFWVICLSTTKFVAKPPSFKGWPGRKLEVLKQGGPQRHSVPEEIWRLDVSPKWQKAIPLLQKRHCAAKTPVSAVPVVHVDIHGFGSTISHLHT